MRGEGVHDAGTGRFTRPGAPAASLTCGSPEGQGITGRNGANTWGGC